MPKVHVRGDKLTVTLPARIRETIAVRDGDEMEMSAEALEDERAGRLSPSFQTAEEIEAWQKTDNYKKFLGKA